MMSRCTGDNVLGAGNQQGRPDEAVCHYVAGFVDGEGSFHIAVQRNPTTRWKWQVIPEFHVSQNNGNQHVLELIPRCWDVDTSNRITDSPEIGPTFWW
jgi:LAGLIDADG endonuclease